MTLNHWEPTTQTNAPHAQIEYVLGGADHRRDSTDVLEVAFKAVDRVRTPKSWKQKKNYPCPSSRTPHLAHRAGR